MKALVTGATGLLGSNLVRELVADGAHVVALVRDRGRAAGLLGTGTTENGTVELVEGDVTDVDGWSEHLRGVDAVFGCAAYFREYYAPGRHDDALRTVNVDAVTALLRAADRAGVPTMVHTSTIGITGSTRDPSGLSDETCRPGERALANGYHRSKWESEQAVAAVLPDVDVRVPIVRPGWMFGPGDAAPTAAGRLVLDVAGATLPVVPAGGNHATDARDVARAMITAAERGVSGRAYHVAAPWQPMSELIGVVAAEAGVRAPRVRMPAPAGYLMALVAEQVAKVTGKPPLATRDGIAALLEERRVSSARAVEELGATFRPFTETVRSTLEWYRAAGMTTAGAAPAPPPLRAVRN